VLLIKTKQLSSVSLSDLSTIFLSTFRNDSIVLFRSDISSSKLFKSLISSCKYSRVSVLLIGPISTPGSGARHVSSVNTELFEYPKQYSSSEFSSFSFHTVHFLLACRASVTIQVGWITAFLLIP